jgi:ribosome-associated heat shock protein Hsp15
MSAVDALRLDIWLDIACLFRTRSEAQKACNSGKLSVNGQSAKSNRVVRAGDEIQISRPFGRKQQIVIQGLDDHHVAKADARKLYEDRTPAPTAEEVAMGKMERMHRAAMTPPRSPDKRARRAIRKMKEGG